MHGTLAPIVESRRKLIDERLDQYTSAADGSPTRLNDAIRYSVLSPGKRLRPLLTLFACEAVGCDWNQALPAACAVEFIHVYSLIHDDLPAMDDDDLRRGKPTCHKEFDEATAILAGDSLQMLAMEILTEELPPNAALSCVQVLAKAAGRRHLVGGQADDLAAEGRFGDDLVPANLESLKRIHLRKTGALIEASLQMGALVGGGNESDLKALSKYGFRVGLAFQIVDDCLDVESTAEQMGKNTRKDDTSGKLTYPRLLGLSESRSLAQNLIGEAIDSLSVFNEDRKHLVELAQFVVDRRS